MMYSIIVFINTIFVSILSLFVINVQGNHISKIIDSIPTNLIKESLRFNYEGLIYEFYFDVDELKSKITSYLDHELKNEVKNYTIGFESFIIDKDNNYKLNFSSYAKNVQFYFSCKYYLDFEIVRYRTFEVKEYYYE